MSASDFVRNTVARFFRAVDEREWDAVRLAMTNPVHMDYSSFGAGDPADLAPDQVVEGWSAFLPCFDCTRHQLGNFEVDVDGTSATVRCYGTATHVSGDEVWTVVGSYDIELSDHGGRWLIGGLRFDFKYQAGATDLPGRLK